MTVKYRLFALIASMMVVLAALACEEEKEPIVFSDLNWTSAQVQNRIAQYIVEEGYGYPTDVVFRRHTSPAQRSAQRRHPGDDGDMAAQPD